MPVFWILVAQPFELLLGRYGGNATEDRSARRELML
jgi:hypothetical protein